MTVENMTRMMTTTMGMSRPAPEMAQVMVEPCFKSQCAIVLEIRFEWIHHSLISYAFKVYAQNVFLSHMHIADIIRWVEIWTLLESKKNLPINLNMCLGAQNNRFIEWDSKEPFH